MGIMYSMECMSGRREGIKEIVILCGEPTGKDDRESTNRDIYIDMCMCGCVCMYGYLHGCMDV